MNVFYHYFLKYIKRFIWLSPFIFYLNGWGSNLNCKHFFSDVHLDYIESILRVDHLIQKGNQALNRATKYFHQHKSEMNPQNKEEANKLITEFKEQLNKAWEKHKAQSLTHLNNIERILKVNHLIQKGNQAFNKATQYFSRHQRKMTPDNKDEAHNLIEEFKEKLNEAWEKHKAQSFAHLNEIKKILKEDRLIQQGNQAFKEATKYFSTNKHEMTRQDKDAAYRLIKEFKEKINKAWENLIAQSLTHLNEIKNILQTAQRLIEDLKVSQEYTRSSIIDIGKTIDPAQEYFSKYKHEMLGFNKNEAFNLIKSLRETLKRAWEAY